MAVAKGDYIYYKTDTRNTSLGAYVCYNSIAKKLDLDPIPIEKWDIEHISNKFRGNLYSRTMLEPSRFDTIDIYTYQNGAKVEKIETIYQGKKAETKDIFVRNNIKKEDKHSVFFGGNQGVTTITTNQKNGKNLLIIKDEYANATIQFFVNHYEKITLIDTNLANADDIKAINIAEYQEAMFLFGYDNFIEKSIIS